MFSLITHNGVYSSLLVGLLVVAPAVVANPGKTIFEEADKRDEGYGDIELLQEMWLTNSQGKQSRRVFEMKYLEGENGTGDKTLIIFKEPKDTQGTALLTHGNLAEDDDQWMYLPNLDRIKRIAPAAKTAYFVGSEFTFEDLANREVEDYEYQLIEDTQYKGMPVHIVELIPTDAKSGYSKQIAWIDADEYRLHKVEFYDKKDALQKTLLFEDYRQYIGKYWRAHRTLMTNHQTNKQTELKVPEEYAFQQGLAERDFAKSQLKRSR
ncbi:MAG TPA: outer membrane lipoprotein-sorting protein [Gammaproteobacteria bacterium]|nr:outer membrane lipoprotein-sorting protein [Gammaproteobacteria bacterium]